MNATHRRPQHSSYRKHRWQVAWQILLPILLAGLLLVAVAVLVWWGTFRASGDVGRWAAISTMWLTIPVMFAGLVMLALLIGLAYLLGRAAGFIPPYTLQAQLFTSKMAAAARRADQVGHRPTLLLPEIGKLLRKVVSRVRGG